MRAWEFTESPGSFLHAKIGLEQISLFLAPLCALNRELYCKWFSDWFERAEMSLILTWFGQFLWLVFFPNGISLAAKRPRTLSWPSLHGMLVYMEACINLRQNIHLFAKNWNEYQKCIICHWNRIPRKLTGCNLS